MICAKVMQAATNDLHDIHVNSYEEFVCYSFRLLPMIRTKVMRTVTNDLHESHADGYE